MGSRVERNISSKQGTMIPLSVAFLCSMVYLEIVFRLLIFKNITINLIFPIVFAVFMALLLEIITTFLNRKINKFFASLFMFLVSLLFMAQLVYYKVFNVFLSAYSIVNGGGQALDFKDVVFSTIGSNILGLLLLFVPTILMIIFGNKKINCTRTNLARKGITLIITVVMFFMAIVVLRFGGTKLYTPYDLYHNTINMDLSMDRLGVVTSMRLDFKHLLFGKGDAQTAGLDADSEGSDEEEAADPNIMNIDFDELIKNDTDDQIKKLDQYFSKVTPTNKNDYTGMFKGYNLIYITAEGFSKYAVDKELTPTLYKMANNGFVFNNYYNPIWGVSTSDGEYVTCLGLIPESGTWSFEKSGEQHNYLPFNFAQQFKKLGAKPKAYHDHSYEYYSRNLSHPNMGYDFKAYGHGLDVDYTWPESDLQMMKLSVNDYINDDIFHAYYMTVSGHLVYNFTGNYIASKNKKYVKDLDEPDNVKAYLACNIEFDRAMKYLLKKLEEAGKADNTLIVINGDHYPYGLVDESFAGAKKGTLDGLAGKKIEGTTEMYRSTAIIYSPSMKQPVNVDKYCSSLDLVPTVSNLLGIEYDSRLLIGKDVMSDSSPLVIFSDRSFITDKCKYNSVTGKVTNLTKEKVTDDYVEKIKKIVNNKFNVSASILDKDYYSHVIKKEKTDNEQ